MYTYRQIFFQAFRVVWNNPIIWFFGLFAALLGSINGLEMILGSYTFSGEGIISSFFSGLAEGGLFTYGGVSGFAQVLATNPVAVFALAIVSLLLIAATIFIIWLVTVSLGALIAKAIAFSKNKKLSLTEAMQIGIDRFWRILALNLGIRLFVWLIVMATVGLAAIIGRSALSFIAYIISYCLLLGLTIIIAFIANYAICGVILRNWKLGQSLNSAAQIFRQNWLLSIELSIILFLISTGVNSFLWFFLAWALYSSISIFISFPLALLTIGLLLTLIFIAVEILLTIFQWSVWALVFEILSNNKKLLISRIQAIFYR